MGIPSRLIQGQQSRCGCASRQVLQHPRPFGCYMLSLPHPGNNQAIVMVPHRMRSLKPPTTISGPALCPARASLLSGCIKDFIAVILCELNAWQLPALSALQLLVYVQRAAQYY